MLSAIMMIDFHSVSSIPATNSSVMSTTMIDIRNPTSHRLSIRKGSVISLRIPHMTRLMSPRINVNIKREFVPSVSVMPGRYLKYIKK